MISRPRAHDRAALRESESALNVNVISHETPGRQFSGSKSCSETYNSRPPRGMRSRLKLDRIAVLSLLLVAGACSSYSHPEKPATQVAFGTAVAKKGLWREAAFRYEQAVAKDPNNARAHNNLAVSLEASGDFARALAEYKKALEIEPERQLHPPQLRALRRVLHVVHEDDRKGRRCTLDRRARPRRSARGPAARGVRAARASTRCKLRLPLKPKLPLRGNERIALAPFILVTDAGQGQGQAPGQRRPPGRVPPLPEEAAREEDEVRGHPDAARRQAADPEPRRSSDARRSSGPPSGRRPTPS